MPNKKAINIGKEVEKIHPLILREITMKQMSIFSEDKMSVTHMVVLDLLKERGSCKMGDIAKALHITMSAVTGIVDKMNRIELVKRERSSEDRRIVWVSLLPKGKKIIEKINRERVSAVNTLFSGLMSEEKEEYVRLLRKVYDQLIKGSQHE
ncbi:MAG: MarR family transcriptional regulator [Candidatus Omnitrophota bacterium]